jgi:hypothetical protein
MLLNLLGPLNFITINIYKNDILYHFCGFQPLGISALPSFLAVNITKKMKIKYF